MKIRETITYYHMIYEWTQRPEAAIFPSMSYLKSFLEVNTPIGFA